MIFSFPRPVRTEIEFFPEVDMGTNNLQCGMGDVSEGQLWLGYGPKSVIRVRILEPVNEQLNCGPEFLVESIEHDEKGRKLILTRQALIHRFDHGEDPSVPASNILADASLFRVEYPILDGDMKEVDRKAAMVPVPAIEDRMKLYLILETLARSDDHMDATSIKLLGGHEVPAYRVGDRVRVTRSCWAGECFYLTARCDHGQAWWMADRPEWAAYIGLHHDYFEPIGGPLDPMDSANS
jgi:hypothetical protein